ncbi:MAG TPA: hypothetical protein VGM04_05615 [Sphingomicrobium sp.]|jgi:hypothetical protein
MSVDQLPLETKISITGTRLYEPIRNICLTLDAFTFASCALHGQEVPEHIERTGGHIIHGHLPISLMTTYGSTFSTGLSGQQEPPIWVILQTREAAQALWERTWRGGGHSGDFSRLKQFMNDGAAVQFVMYYENFYPWVKAQALHNVANLEPTWGFGRVVRNAIGHAGKVAINDRSFAPVEWGGLRYGRAENGRVVIGNDMHASDLIILMLDMDRALSAMGYAPPA